MRAIWKGALSFGLVNIPVKLYSATEEKAISFKEICPFCGGELRHKRWCPNCEKEIAWQQVRKGYKISKERCIILSKQELEAALLKATKNIEILLFIDKAQLDPILLNKHYFLVPDEGGEKAYCLFKEVLSLTGKVAIGKVTMRNKQYLVAIMNYKNGLLCSALHYAYEIRDITALEELDIRVELKKEEKELAKLLIEKLTGEFDITKFRDEYAEALKEVIKSKLAGEVIRVEVEERAEKAKSLMEALKVSIEAAEKKKREKSP